MSDLEDGPLVLEVLEDLGVHLQIHFKDFAEDRVQAVVQHPGLVLAIVADKGLAVLL